MNSISVPISVGELIDKISILEIKADKIPDGQNLYVLNELTLLREIYQTMGLAKLKLFPYLEKLRAINKELWEIEDEIRVYERKKIFDDKFVILARKVYQKNDVRFQIKSEINQVSNSKIVETKHFS